MKGLLFGFCICVNFLTLSGQNSTFLKVLHQYQYVQSARVIPASDKGWFLVSLDSLKLYKFSACGNLEWAQKYSFPALSWRGVDVIATKTGGVAFLVMNYPSSSYHAILVNVDGQGNVIWSKSFYDNPFVEVPYTLLEDDDGNFFLYGNVTLVPNNDVYNSLTKISTGGNVLWRKLYNHGGIWGGAIRTQDKGFLLRTGSRFIKTDISGNEQWTSSFIIGMYQYHKAVEVEDGYIFNGYNNNALGGDSISFIKMDKLGMLQWGGAKIIDFKGTPQDLISKYNGNFIFIHHKSEFSKYYSTLTELDKNLQIVNQSATENIDFNSSFHYDDICFLKDSSALIAGNFTINDPTVFPHLGFIRADINHHFGCDTTLFSLQSRVRPVSQSTIPTTVTSRNFASTNEFILSVSFLDSTFTVCSNLAALQLNLGIDTSICEGSSITLKNRSSVQFDRFIWSTGSSASEINISQSGIYWLRAINSCRMDSVSDTIFVNFNSFPNPTLLGDTSICSELPIVLDASISNASYVWQDGSTEAKFYAFEPGTYSVDISFLNCSKQFESHISDCEILILPNIITPNNDVLNTTFIPIEMRGIISLNLKVFNRWGQEIYFTTDVFNRPWKGNAYSKDCPEGVYFWIVEYTNYLHVNKVQKGSVSLFRE